MKATKAQRLAAARELYPSYDITGVKKMSTAELAGRFKYGYGTLEELYASPSDAKRASYKDILKTYQPAAMTLSGNNMAYSVLLRTHDGVIMHITRDNNYLVEAEA